MNGIYLTCLLQDQYVDCLPSYTLIISFKAISSCPVGDQSSYLMFKYCILHALAYTADVAQGPALVPSRSPSELHTLCIQDPKAEGARYSC